MTKLDEGCELCGDWPIHLHSRCHLTAPLMAVMEDENTLVLKCYLPECGREVARFSIKESSPQ